MATRGTGYLLMKEKYLESTEFNGDMYPSGHGDNFFNNLKKVKTEEDFTRFINEFNDESFGYDDEELVFEVNSKHIYDNRLATELVIDFNNDYFGRFFSDWIFFKNMTGMPIRFICRDEKRTQVVLKDKESYRFDFGKVEKED